MRLLKPLTHLVLLFGPFTALVGCSHESPEAMTPPPAVVSVSLPLERDVTDFSNFTGRTAAKESVKVRARVWGSLQKIDFVEGALVQKDDLLFEIDPRPYQAAVNKAKAAVEQAEAHSNRLESDYQRAIGLLNRRAISQEDFDKIVGDRKEAVAAVGSARASLDSAQLNLDYTKVTAPVSGRVSRALVTVGNLVESGETGGTLLTTIVSVDPMYAYLDVDDLTFLKIKDLLRVRSSTDQLPPVHLALTGEKGYPHSGVIDFVDNQVESGTGTLRVRGVFPNKDGALTPGLFARLRVPLGRPHKAILVTDRAVDTDQGQKVVYVVDDKNVVEKRPVELGELHDGLREIQSGVKPGERIVVDGIQRVRGGVTVEPHMVEMPGK
jgi:RND family efflux transporter MFP subunit